MKKISWDGYAAFFDVLASNTRLRIINSLRTSPKNVTQIIAETKLEQSCASHCLKKLETGGFVSVKRQGKFRVYELNHETIEPLVKLIDAHIAKNRRDA